MRKRVINFKEWLRNESRSYDGKLKTACFTGHRPKDLHGYVKEPYVPLVETVTELCADLHFAAGVDTFISGGAQGFDQLAFWAVNKLNEASTANNVVYVPFPSQPNVWRETGLFGRSEHALMLRKATRVKVVSDDPADKRGAVTALHARNHAMVDDSDFVVALLAPKAWDLMDPAKRDAVKGGTAECVKYALERNKPVIAIRYDVDRAAVLDVEVLVP